MICWENNMKKGLIISDDLFQSDMNVSLNPNADNFIKEVPVELLEDDPNNVEIYGECIPGSMTDSIKEYGIREPIRAYKLPKSSKYLIQSGHRRKYDAIANGLKTVPVIELDWIEDENERKRLLIDANIHNRHRTPAIIAKEVTNYLETYHGDNSSKMEILAKVAAHFGMSEMTMRRYLNILELIPELQNKIDSGDYPLSGIIEAKVMTTEQQIDFNHQLDQFVQKYGIENLTRSVIIQIAKDMKHANQPKKTTGVIKPPKTFYQISERFIKTCETYKGTEDYYNVLIEMREKIDRLIKESAN